MSARHHVFIIAEGEPEGCVFFDTNHEAEAYANGAQRGAGLYGGDGFSAFVDPFLDDPADCCMIGEGWPEITVEMAAEWKAEFFDGYRCDGCAVVFAGEAFDALTTAREIPAGVRVAAPAQTRVLPDCAWATPSGVEDANVALFSLIAVLRAAGQAVHADRVRIAALITRKPALALPFMDATARHDWMRVVGDEARPLPGNVIPLSRFQKGATDRAWADAVRQLSGTGALVEDRAAGTWAAGPRLPASGQDWIEGRAAMAVRLLDTIEVARAEQNLVAFVREVEHAAAGSAVS